jgi:hypothetical protein
VMNGGTKAGFSTVSLERLQCTRRDSAGPTERRRRTRVRLLQCLGYFVVQVYGLLRFDFCRRRIMSLFKLILVLPTGCIMCTVGGRAQSVW